MHITRCKCGRSHCGNITLDIFDLDARLDLSPSAVGCSTCCVGVWLPFLVDSPSKRKRRNH
eukprot:898150-Prorocentrum_minimum.AAC.2